MHQHNHSTQNQNGSGFIIRHLFLLVLSVLILAVLYAESRSMKVVGFGAVLLLAAHVLAVVVILYGGRRFLRGFIAKIHGSPSFPESPHTHHHAGDELETTGKTISWARFYDLFVRLLFSGKVQVMMRSTVQLANIQPGEKVLDIGCGTGTLAILAKQTGGQSVEIYGRDAAPEMIEHAREKARQQKVDVDFQPGLAEAIQFPDETFDLVMNSLMMHHLPADLREKALVEMYRVLKPGGRLLVVDFEPPKKGLYRSFLTLILGEMTSIDNTAIPPLVRNAGFKNVEIGTTDTSIATYITGKKTLA